MPPPAWEEICHDPMRIPYEDLVESFDRGALQKKGGERSLSSVDPIFAEQMVFEVMRVAPKGWPILSVGCGDGEVEDKIALTGADVIALDMRAVRANVPWVQGDAHALPIRTGSCGTVLLSESIGQVNPERVFAEAARVLVPEGFLVLSTYHLKNGKGEGRIPYPWGGSIEYPSTHKQIEDALVYWTIAMYRLYPDDLLCAFLDQAGFRLWKKSVHRYSVGETGYTDILMLVGQKR